MNTKLRKLETEKKVLALISRIQTYLLIKSKTVTLQELTSREVKVNRYWNVQYSRYVEDTFYKSEIRIMDESMGYTVTIYEDLVKQFQLELKYHVTELDKTEDFYSGSKNMTFDFFMNLTDDELFEGFKRVENIAEAELEESLNDYRDRQ